MKRLLKYTFIGLLLLAVSGLAWWNIADYQVYESRPQKPMSEYVDLETDFQKLFQLAKDGETIRLPEGHFTFSKALILDGKRNVTIKGAGMDKTVLSFREQKEGAEGMRLANCKNLTLEDFTIQDAIGDNIKAIYTDTLTFRRIKTEWTDVPNTELGAYGLYPVICKNVLVENCVALRASDSGLYIGQSENIVIRNNKTYENVCGINVENSENVEIYNNQSFNNTSGMTILDIPGLTRYCKNICVHHNKLSGNNLFNFAPAGNIAASNVPGSGLLLWAAKETQVYENEFLDQAFPILMVSFLTTNKIGQENEYVPIAASEQARMEVAIEEETSLREDAINAEFETDQEYSPYSENVYFGNNQFSFGSFRKKIQSKDGFLFALGMGFKNAQIWFDGVNNPNGSTLCLDETEEVVVADLDFMNEFNNASIKKADNYACDT
jgi:parallel beta-helix repeat protein